MAINCNSPNKACGNRCIPPDEVCGGKDEKVSSEANQRLTKLSKTIQSVKPPAPKQRSFEQREIDFERQKLAFDKEISGKEPNDITLKQRQTRKRLKRQGDSLKLEKREKNLNKKQEKLDSKSESKNKQSGESKFSLGQLAASLSESFDATQQLVGSVEGFLEMDIVSQLSGTSFELLKTATKGILNRENTNE